MDLSVKLKAGSRVGVIANATEGIVYFIGFGRYSGDHVPDKKASGVLASMCRVHKHKTPKIVLEGDKGVIYGCECWWGTVRNTNKIINNSKHVIDTSVEFLRTQTNINQARKNKKKVGPPKVNP